MHKNTPAEITSYCLKKARSAGSTFTEILLIKDSMISARCRLGKTETIERSEAIDLGIRVIIGKNGKYKQAVVSTNEISKEVVDQAVKRAVDMAKTATVDPYISILPLSSKATKISDVDIYDPKAPTIDKLIKNSTESESAALKVKGVTNSEGTETSYTQKSVTMASSDGFIQSYKGSSCGMSLSIIAGKGMDMQTDYDYSIARYFSDLRAPSELGRIAGQRAVQKLHPRKVKTCQVPLIFEARIAREIVDVVASAVNGSSIARKTSFLLKKMNKRIFPEGISIVDDPYIKRGISSRPFDGEGIVGKKLNIVEDGVLNSWLLDSKSAKQLNLKTNGRAVRGISSPPHPTHTNIYMENGAVSLKDMIADIKNGFYVTDAFGMGINMITGDYSQGASGFWIENGKISYPVSEVTIAGNLSDMFMNLTPANDLEFLYGINSPSLRIEGMTVAGS